MAHMHVYINCDTNTQPNDSEEQHQINKNNNSSSSGGPEVIRTKSGEKPQATRAGYTGRIIVVKYSPDHIACAVYAHIP